VELNHVEHESTSMVERTACQSGGHRHGGLLLEPIAFLNRSFRNGGFGGGFGGGWRNVGLGGFGGFRNGGWRNTGFGGWKNVGFGGGLGWPNGGWRNVGWRNW
jgi:hypothetical protein